MANLGEKLFREELGRKAKELVEGMRQQVKRDPDVADYAAAFEPIFIAAGLHNAALIREMAAFGDPALEVPPCGHDTNPVTAQLSEEQVRWLENLRDEAKSIVSSTPNSDWAKYRAEMAESVLALLRSGAA